VRTRRRSLGVGAFAALVLTLATVGQGSHVLAQQQTFPDAHYCEVDSTQPFNSGDAIKVTASVKCYTARGSLTPGQVKQIGIRIQLERDEDDFPVGGAKEETSPQTTELTTTLTYPDSRSSEPQICSSGRMHAKVTGTVTFKSGTPLNDSLTVESRAAFVTCQTPVPPLPPIPMPTFPDPSPPDPSPTPNPDPGTPPDPDPGPGPGDPCRFPCTPPSPGDPPA
jgi:hypothetical protein